MCKIKGCLFSRATSFLEFTLAFFFAAQGASKPAYNSTRNDNPTDRSPVALVLVVSLNRPCRHCCFLGEQVLVQLSGKRVRARSDCPSAGFPLPGGGGDGGSGAVAETEEGTAPIVPCRLPPQTYGGAHVSHKNRGHGLVVPVSHLHQEATGRRRGPAVCGGDRGICSKRRRRRRRRPLR